MGYYPGEIVARGTVVKYLNDSVMKKPELPMKKLELPEVPEPTDPFELLTEDEKNLLADQLGEYYDWCTKNGGVHPDILLKYPHTPQQRKVLLARMDDLNVLLSHLAPIVDPDAPINQVSQTGHNDNPPPEPC